MKNEITGVACPICNSNHSSRREYYTASAIITDVELGEIICSKCGTVINDRIEDNTRPDSRTFGNERDYNKSRLGPPTSVAYHDLGLSTTIGRTDKDASGHKLDSATYTKMQRLRTWNQRTLLYKATDRNLIIAFHKLFALKDKLRLTDAVVEKAAYTYRKAQQRGIIRGRTIDSILGAAVYAACRELGIPKTLNEVAHASSIREKRISKAYRILSIELAISTPMLDPMKCIVKVANKISLNERTKRKAIAIMNTVTEREISAGKDPMGMAATVIYLSCLGTGENKTQVDIAKAAGVTEVTVRNRFKDLKNKLELSN
ncbi:MAG TPA: transcription initiation factor IIB [Nitrososphaeraceae archaeon]